MRINPMFFGVLAIGIACKDSATAPSECATSVGSVNVTVTGGLSPVFDWSPRCPVAMILVEDDATDQWILSVPNLDENTTESANVITAPVTYGETRAGLQSTTPELLKPGLTYEVILWKIVPPNSTVQCQQRFENACLLAVHEFTP